MNFNCGEHNFYHVLYNILSCIISPPFCSVASCRFEFLYQFSLKCWFSPERATFFCLLMNLCNAAQQAPAQWDFPISSVVKAERHIPLLHFPAILGHFLMTLHHWKLPWDNNIWSVCTYTYDFSLNGQLTIGLAYYSYVGQRGSGKPQMGSVVGGFGIALGSLDS